MVVRGSGGIGSEKDPWLATRERQENVGRYSPAFVCHS